MASHTHIYLCTSGTWLCSTCGTHAFKEKRNA